MIAKGNPHGDGAKLAKYLTTAKNGERVEVAELRGFVADNVRDAFIDTEIQAEATKCETPFFHVSVRPPADERLTREQWQITADRIEKKLGFTGQPRAIVFHHEANGDTHMHVAWSRIDLDKMRAIDPGLYKNKLKEISRELEKEFGLTRVRNERDAEEKTRSPDRDEFEQARRLGTDLKAIRETIRDCWDRSDNGQAFAAALEQEDLILARGDKRDFVVVDRDGGYHALGKRITGATAADTRARMADIDARSLPDVAQAKEIKHDRSHGLASARDEMQWEDRLAAAAIEKAERQDATGRSAARAEDDKAMLRISDKAVARDLAYHQRQEAKPYTATETKVMDAFRASTNGMEFTEKLKQEGLSLAIATAGDVKDLGIERAVEFAAHNPRTSSPMHFVPKVREGELAAVDRFGGVHRFNEHKIDIAALEGRAAETADGALPSIGRVRAVKQAERDRRDAEQQQRRAAFAEQRGIDAAFRKTEREMRAAERSVGKVGRAIWHTTDDTALKGVKVVNRGMAAGGQVAGFIANLFSGLFAPSAPKSPAQLREDAKATAQARVDHADRRAAVEKESEMERFVREYDLRQRETEEREREEERSRTHRKRDETPAA
jgi:hypothetical protein